MCRRWAGPAQQQLGSDQQLVSLWELYMFGGLCTCLPRCCRWQAASLCGADGQGSAALLQLLPQAAAAFPWPCSKPPFERHLAVLLLFIASHCRWQQTSAWKSCLGGSACRPWPPLLEMRCSQLLLCGCAGMCQRGSSAAPAAADLTATLRHMTCDMLAHTVGRSDSTDQPTQADTCPATAM